MIMNCKRFDFDLSAKKIGSIFRNYPQPPPKVPSLVGKMFR